MKQLASNYSISGSTVTLTGVNVPLSQILLISDATTGNVLYSMAGPAAASYTQGTNSTITLATAPGASDKLTIYFDDGVAPANAPTSVSVSNFPATQPVSGTVAVSNQPTSIQVSNFPTSVEISNDVGNAIPVSGTVTVSNPQTSVSVSNFPATQPVSGTVNTGLSQPLTDTQLRASAVPVSLASAPLPTGAAQDGTDGTGITAPTGGSGIRGWLSGIYGKLSSALSVSQSGTWSIGRTWTLASANDSVTIQGGNSAAVKVDGSGVTQPVSIADGSDSAEGSKADSAANNSTSSWSVIALLKGLYAALTGTPSVGAVSATNTVNTTGIVPSTGNLLINSTDVSAYRSVTLQVTPVSTAAGTFQAQVSSDGTNWVYISGQSSAPSSGGTTTSSYLSGSGGNYLIATTSFNTFQLTGARYFRVYIPSGSGTGTVNTTAFFSSLPVQPTLVQDSSNNLLVAGTVTANGGPNATFTYSATIPSTPTTIIGPITCSNYKVASVHFVALGTGASFTAQYSNDGTNWVSAPTQRCDSPGSFGQSFGSFTSPGAGQMHQVYLYGAQYFRIFGSSTSGTTTIIVNLSQTLLQIPVQYVINTNALTTNPQVGVTTASSGFSSFHSLSCAASTNATSVKATAGQIGSLILSNNASTWAYFHLVNKTSAPTVGTDSGLLNIGVAPNSTLDCSASFAGLRLSSGIAYYVSTGPSATDTGALAAANTFVINLAYA